MEAISVFSKIIFVILVMYVMKPTMLTPKLLTHPA